MTILKRVTRSNFFIKLFNWEYWPFGIIQFPLFFYFAWLAMRARSMVFFTASNPGIAMGGMFGESKFDILEKLPETVKPKTLKISTPTTATAVVETMRKNGMSFPLIFKPDIGERGFMVTRIDKESEVDQYAKQVGGDFLVQELVDLPLEFGTFYRRYPDEEKGRVTSIIKKEFLSVTGDGKSTLEALILDKPRAKLQWEKLQVNYASELHEVIPSGVTKQLVAIGNHCMGTMFLDGKDLINEKMCDSFDRISKHIDGFYFGRFDLRCASLEDLYEGKVKIVEVNGCGAEPAHIYDPSYRLFTAIGVLFHHWSDIFEISRQNKKRGVQYLSLKEAIAYYNKFKAVTR